MENVLLFIGLSIFGIVFFFMCWIFFARWMNNRDVEGRISVRVRNDPAPARTYLADLQSDNRVDVHLPTGVKTFILPDRSTYAARWPLGAIGMTQAIIREVEVDGVSFKPIMLKKPDPLEDAGILAKICKDTTLEAIMRAWSKVNELVEKIKNFINPIVLYILLGISALAAVGTIAFLFYIQSQTKEQLQTIIDGLKSLGAIP